MLPLRILIGVLIAAAVGVALIPLAVLLDLHEGGTGWGLCDAGVEGCTNSYFAGFEMLVGVAIALAAILALIAVCVRLMRWMERRKARQVLG
jgi:hypothetical protein